MRLIEAELLIDKMWKKHNEADECDDLKEIYCGVVSLIDEMPTIEDSCWIPIGNGLPPVGVPLIVTIYDSIRNRRELRYPVYYRKGFFSGNYGFYLYGDEEHLLLPEYSEVLAWQRFPLSYEGE